MARWILLTQLILISSCALETEKEEVRVVYFTGQPQDTLETEFAELKITVNSPRQLTLNWPQNGSSYLRVGPVEEKVDCHNGRIIEPHSAGTLVIDHLSPGTEYAATLCQEGEDVQHWFQFSTPKYNLMTPIEWCEYQGKSEALSNGFSLLLRELGISSCQQIPTRSLQNKISLISENSRPIDLYPFAELSEVITEIELEKFDLTNLADLSQFAQVSSLSLREVTAEGKPIEDLSFLQSLPLLHSVELIDIAPVLLVNDELSGLHALRKLHLASQGVVSLSAHSLSGLQIDILEIKNGFFPNLDPFLTQPHLKALSIIASKLNSLQGIDTFQNLESLDLAENQIANLTPLQNHTTLRKLVLAGNPIADISPVFSIPQLSYLDIRRTEIASVAPLRDIEGPHWRTLLFAETPAFQTETCPFRRFDICQDFVGSHP